MASVPERLITLGVVWRWKRAKGLDYAEEFRTYQYQRLQAANRNSGVRVLELATSFGSSHMRDRRRNAYSVAV